MKTKFVIIVLFLLGFVAHGNTLRNELFWDDDDNIVKNVYIKDFRYLDRLFTRSQIEGSLGQLSNQYRPLLMLTFSLEHHLWGLWAAGYHLVNVLLHIGNSVMVFLFIKLLLRISNFESGARWAISNFSNATALLTSLLFLLHPIQTEAVAYVAGRTDLLATFFILVGLFVFSANRIRNQKSGIRKETSRNIFMILVYILALLSKETAIIFPLLLFITDYFFISHSISKTIKNNLRLFSQLGAVAAIYVFLRLSVFNFQNSLNFYGTTNLFTSNIFYRIFTFFHALTIYTQLLIAPLDLHAERIIPIAKTWEPATIVGFVLSVLSGAIIVLGLKNQQAVPPRSIFHLPSSLRLRSGQAIFRVSSYGLLWFWITIFLTTNIPVPINSLLAEHFLYTPSIGLFFIGATVLIYTAGKVGDTGGRALTILLFLVFSFYIFRTFVRNREWHDPIVFYEQTLRYTPASARVRNNLAMNYADRGNHEQAIKNYRLAIQTTDVYPQTHYNLGNSLTALDLPQEALKEYQRAIELDANFLPAYGNLIKLLLRIGEKAQAKAILLKLEAKGVISQTEIQNLLKP